MLGPVLTVPGDSAYLYEADSTPAYAWVVKGAANLPETQVVGTLKDPRFPVGRLAIYADTAQVSPKDVGGVVPEPSRVAASVTEWRPGRIVIRLEGQETEPAYLLVAENWYKDWRAMVDGKATPVLRANHTLLSVVVPPGAREVVLEFSSAAYVRGRAITFVSMAGLLVLFGVATVRRRPVGPGAHAGAQRRQGGVRRRRGEFDRAWSGGAWRRARADDRTEARTMPCARF